MEIAAGGNRLAGADPGRAHGVDKREYVIRGYAAECARTQKLRARRSEWHLGWASRARHTLLLARPWLNIYTTSGGLVDASIDGIQIVSVHAVPTREFSEEKITGALLPETKFASASINFVPVNGAQTPHYQDRPLKGDEIVFVYAGTFRIVSGDRRSRVFNADQQGPVYFLVRSGTPATVENCGHDIVKFFSVFAPPFQEGEVHFLDAVGG
jgi:hypothetical protein